MTSFQIGFLWIAGALTVVATLVQCWLAFLRYQRAETVMRVRMEQIEENFAIYKKRYPDAGANMDKVRQDFYQYFKEKKQEMGEK